MKYYTFNVDTNDAQKAAAEAGAHGLVVRTHAVGNATQVWVASDTPPDAKVKAKEVSEAEVLKIG